MAWKDGGIEGLRCKVDIIVSKPFHQVPHSSLENEGLASRSLSLDSLWLTSRRYG